MKIIYRDGDVLKAPEKHIVHGCNAQGEFKSGVAGQIRKVYPKAYETYRRAYESVGLNVGMNIWVDCEDHVIVNAITQPTYGYEGDQHVDYDGIRKCMEAVNRYFKQRMPTGFGRKRRMEEIEIPRIAMPMIGAGLGGGDWSLIEGIIESSLTDVQPVVYRFK